MARPRTPPSHQALLKLLASCPTSIHTSRYLIQQFEEAGFERLDESTPWKLRKNQRYVLPVGSGSVLAWTTPNKPSWLSLLGCHTESPMLRIKSHGFGKEEGYWTALVEMYGSPILSSWFFKDLGLAGRFFVRHKEGIKEHFVHFNEPIGILLSPAIHLQRDMNDKGLVIDKQKHLKVLLGNQGQHHPVEKRLLELAQLSGSFQDVILSHELYFYPLESPQTFSTDIQWLASWRIDNLASCGACLQSMIHSKPDPNVLAMALFADHEEIGSQTSSGAASGKYPELIERILQELGLASHEKAQMLSKGFLCSVDGAHGLHPVYNDLYEPLHKPKLGEGPVIKYNSSGRYASSAQSCAIIQWHATQARVPLQSFHMRADLPCGSTIGPILSTSLGLEGVDIGLPQLAMHASRELMHLGDYEKLVHLLTHVLQTPCQLSV